MSLLAPIAPKPTVSVRGNQQGNVFGRYIDKLSLSVANFFFVQEMRDRIWILEKRGRGFRRGY